MQGTFLVLEMVSWGYPEGEPWCGILAMPLIEREVVLYILFPTRLNLEKRARLCRQNAIQIIPFYQNHQIQSKRSASLLGSFLWPRARQKLFFFFFFFFFLCAVSAMGANSLLSSCHKDNCRAPIVTEDSFEEKRPHPKL